MNLYIPGKFYVIIDTSYTLNVDSGLSNCGSHPRKAHWWIQGGAPGTCPPTGSNSFIFAHVFTEKHTCRRSAPPTGRRPPNGKSWIRHWNASLLEC